MHACSQHMLLVLAFLQPCPGVSASLAQPQSHRALVVSERTQELKVVTSGIIISTMPPVPLPKRAVKASWKIWPTGYPFAFPVSTVSGSCMRGQVRGVSLRATGCASCRHGTP